MAGQGQGTPEDPWVLATPPGTSSYTMHRDEASDPPQLVCVVEKGLRGRFAPYVPPLLEALGRAELEHQPRGNRMRAL